MAQNNFLQSPFDALATATEESIYSLPPLPGQKSSTPTQVSEVPRDTRAPAVEQPEEPAAGQPVKAKPGQYLPPANLRPVFEAAAREFNVPVNVLMALGHQESRFNPAAIGPSTQWGRAKGMMQYLDSTASGLGINPFDPNQAVPAAARQLRERLDKGYSMEDAVKEHFAGPNRKLWGEKTAAYGREVMQKVGFIGEELGAGAPPAAAADPLADMNKAEPGRYRVATPEEVAAFEKKQAAMTEAERVESAAQQKKNDDRGFGERTSEALSSGTDNMVQSLNTSRFVMAGGDSQLLAKALADKFAAGQERAKQKTTGEREMDASFQAVTDAEGVVDTTLAGAKAIGTAVMNPKDLAVGVIEQLPNMLPTMGAGVAGAGAGGVTGAGVGAVAGGVGAIPGAITGAIWGGRAGMVAGTTATELGAEVEYMIGKRLEEAKQPPTPENIKALLDDPLFIGEARKQGLAKGLTVGLIDQLFMGLAGKVAGKTASAATKTGKVALGTGAVGLDATGEVVGEAASQQVARGEVDAGDALKEGVYGLGQSIVEPAVGATMQAASKAAKAMRPGEVPPRVEPGTAPAATPPAAPAAQTPAAPQAPATPSGPLTAAVERAAETPAEQPPRVSVVAPEGEVTGFMESMQEDGQGGFVARVLGDDGQVYTFTSADGVSITPLAPEPAGPLTAAVEQVAAAQPEVAPVVEPVADPVAEAAPAEPVLQPAAPVDVAEDRVSQPPQAAPTLAEMDEPALRERLKYIASQGKANGWNKLLMNARREVEAEINKRTEGAKTDERADSSGVRVPDVSAGSVQADAPRGADQPAGREGDAQLRDGVQADPGPAVPEDGNAVPAAGAAADRQPALTPKQSAALDRIAKGTAFFGTPEKADAFIAKNEIGDTHEVVQTGKVRFEVKPKVSAASESNQLDKTSRSSQIESILKSGGKVVDGELRQLNGQPMLKLTQEEINEIPDNKKDTRAAIKERLESVYGKRQAPPEVPAANTPQDQVKLRKGDWVSYALNKDGDKAIGEVVSISGDSLNVLTDDGARITMKRGDATYVSKASAAAVPVGGTVTKDEPPEENKLAAEQAPAPAEPLISAPEENKPVEQAWSESSPADRRKMLADAGYTDGDQARVLSDTNWADLSDDVRGKIELPAVVDQEPIKNETPAQQGSTAAEQESDQETTLAAGSLVDSLYGQVSSGNMPSDNNALRKMVAEIDGAPADNTRLKAAQEALEAAMVRLARDIVAEGKSIRETYDKLVALYASQPNLNIRTSTSIENQAYSTPAPLAYLAAKLAGIDANTKVYEPTAGNGMLLITADPKNATANELEDTRFANLKSLGFDAMQGDAMDVIASGAVVAGSQDAVITNPPFGSVKDENGKATKVSVDGYKIGKIDHLIAAEALKAMKDNGKATLIIGADKVAGGVSTDDRIFFNWLYGNYDVTSHFEADGKLYARQGANWPVRVITINGRKKSSAVSPRHGDVKRVSTWEEVYEQYQQGLDAQIGNDGGAAVSPDGAVQRGRADDAGASPVAAGAEDRADGAAKPAARARSDGNVAGERAGTVRTGAAGATERTAGDTGAQRRNEPAAVPDRLEEGSAKDRSAGGKARADRPAGDAGADRVGNEFQTTYVPRSSNKDEGILIPVNMAQPTQDALNALEDEVGDIDEYVMRELGYPSKKSLHDALMGLQVDSVAAAIFQISSGKGIIISDMTGVGKGRQAAAIIRWATRKGHTPVFVTVKPSLFTDMFNDLADIGTNDVAPLLLNADEWIANAAGEKLFTNKKSAHRKVIADIAATGELPQGRNALFLTYSQINTENAQREAIGAIAEKSVIVLDECVPAGTMIATPSGAKAIETLKVGDVVIGVDHLTGNAVATPVLHTFRRDTEQALVRIGSTEMTPEHPVFTKGRGYVASKNICASDVVCSIMPHAQTYMPAVPEELRDPEEGLKVLFNQLRGSVSQRKHDSCAETGALGEKQEEHDPLAQRPAKNGRADGISEVREEPNQEPSYASKVGACLEGVRVQELEWRERDGSYSSADASVCEVGLGNGNTGRHWPAQAGDADALHDRHRGFVVEDSGRGGWGQSSIVQSKGERSEKRRVSTLAWMDGAALLKQRGDGGLGSCGEQSSSSREVFNIETGTANYFANGLLVHNCHNAAGDSSTGTFIRDVLGKSAGVLYLSATYAKRPDNMPVYFKTDIGMAISDDGQLTGAMAAGGLPLQTVVSHNLVKAGQMFRRERSYDGVSITTTADTARREEHEKLSDTVTLALRGIVEADKAFHNGFVEQMAQQLAKEGAALKDISGNQASQSVNHTEFSSVVHNFVRQMLLGLKADSAADKAIEALKSGQKPLIAVENTMGSFLAEYAANSNIRQGQPLGRFDYRTVLERALERSRVIVIKDATGNDTKRKVELSELDPVTRDAYDRAQAIIRSLDLDIPVSPIDWMRNRIEQAGYTVAEITGRNLTVNYSEGAPKLSQLPTEEQNDKVGTTRKFNDGRLDAIILNVSGSTGISLHASEKFKDKRPRKMIVAQAAQDINIFCLDAKTEILTPDGFKGINDDFAKVAAFDVSTGVIEWRPVTGRIERSMNPGETMYGISSPGLDIRVTGQHRMVMKGRRNSPRWSIVDASKLADRLASWFIPVSGVQPAEGVALSDDEIRFVGWFLTDGSIRKVDGGMHIYQSEHQPHNEAIQSCLNGCGFKFSISRSAGQSQFSRTSDLLCYYVGRSQFEHLTEYLDKDFPVLFERLDRRQLGVLIEALHLGDGTKFDNQPWTCRSFHISTGRPVFAERLQSLCVRRGYSASLSTHFYNANPIQFVRIKDRTVRHVGGPTNGDGRPTFGLLDSAPDEKVWCVENGLGTLIVRRNGKVAIVGNCQMLGRIHRTGQVTLPSYEILSVDLPAEKRPTSILSNKMKSLNANTSSNTESATSIKSSDLLNKYGDQVVGAYLADNDELSQALGIQDPMDSEGRVQEDLARKATGRLALMPVEVQKAFYAEVEEQYGNLIDYLNKTNQNELEPRTFDYDAKETAAQVIFEGDNPSSPFGADAIYHEYSIKAQGKPMTPDEIRAEIVESLGGKDAKQHASDIVAGLDAQFAGFTARLTTDGQMSAANIAKRKAGEFIRDHRIGSGWRVEINGDVYNAVVTNIRSTHKGAGNPFSMSKIQVTVALNGALRSVTVPATQFEGIEVAGLGAAPRIDGMFEQTPQDERQTTKIITGNLLAAYGEISTKGTIINFTKADGTTEQGILLPKVFNPAINTRGDYRMRSVADVLRFLRESEDTNIARFGVSNREGTVRVVPDGAGVALVVPKSKAKGGKFFLNKKLTDITGDFVSQGQTMRVEIPASKAADAVAVIMDMNALYALPSMAAEAKKIIGEAAQDGVKYSVSDFGDPPQEEAAEVAQALAGKSLTDVAEWLSVKHPDGAGRVIADKALESIRRHEKDGAKTSFRIAGVGDAVSYSLSNGARAETAYSLKRGGSLTIDVTLNGPDVTGRVGTSYETALHEVIHAATTLALDAAEKRAARGMEIEQAFEDLRDLFNFVRMEVSNRAEGGDRQARQFKMLTNMLQNEQEILAWSLSNREAQAFMESIPYQTGNLWTRFVNTIRRLLGLAENAETALSEVLRIGEIAFNQSIVPFVQMAGERRNNQINEPNGQRTLVRDAVESLTEPALRDRLTTGVIGPVVSRLIDAGVIVMHKDVSTLPKSIKAVRGMQAATDGKTVHMVASGLTADTARGTLFHEFFHTGGENLIGTEQWGKLMGRLSSLQKQGQQSNGKAREFFDKARARVQAAEQRGAVTEGLAPEEFGAYAIEEYENAPATVRKWVDDLIGAVKAWALKRFGKQLGDVTPAQLSAIAKMALMDAAAERMIGRPTMMSARGLTDTPAFKRWFKGSKVVDGNGDPLVVYHGTASDFSEFDQEKVGSNYESDSTGFFFTSSPNQAATHAEDAGYTYRGNAEPNIVPAYLQIENPLEFKAKISPNSWYDKNTDYALAEVVRTGADGIVVRGAGGEAVFVVFRPEQIKSAIGNRGAFDPDNPDIRYSSRSKTDMPAFRRWFGSSGAVNTDGSPMVLYHGTGADIAVFDPKRTTSIDGIFTTPKARYASQVAAGAGGAPNVMPLYASIQNAARMKAADYTAANVRKAMADRAIDGVIVTDDNGNVDTVIVKRPEQLKSVFNGGGFDPGSPDVRYSVSPEQAERVIDEALSALDAAPDRLAKDDYIGRVVGDMSLGARLLVHPRTVASVHPEFTPVYMTAISQIETRDANIADLGTGAAAYSKLDEAGKTSVNRALELGRLMSQTYTAEQLAAGVTNRGEKTVVSVGEDGKPRTTTVPVDALLSGAGEVVKLSPEEATAYTDLRAMFDRALDKMRDQTLEELGFPELAGLKNAAREIAKLAQEEMGDKAERLKNIAVFVAEIEQAKRAGYVPFARYGDYVVTVKEKIADLTYVEDDAQHLIVQDVPASFAGDLLDMGAEETPEGWRIKKSQKASVERLTEKTVYSTKVETGLRDFFDERKAGKVDDIAPVREAIEKARAEYVGDNPSRRVVAFKAREKTPDAPVVLSDVDALAEVAQIDNATWDAVRDKLADAIKAKGFRRHFFHSDNVPGYTGDFERAIADYVIGMSGYLARRSHMKKWDNSVTAIKDKPKLFEYASKYRDYVNSPQEEFAMVRQVGFFSYIAGVVASAFANLTQVPMLTLPTLSQIAPVPLVMKEVARAYKDTFKMLGRPGKVGLDMFDPDKAPADVRDALKEAWVEGSFVPLETYDLMMTSRQRNVGARKGVKLFNDTTKVVALFFTFAERVNRLVTFIAAARLSEKPAVRANANRVLRNDALARREVLANWGQKSLAEWAVDETQYRMGKANRPTMMRGVGSAILQFKGYMLQTFEAWYRMSKLHGTEGKFAMAASLVTLYALSGLWGMPGADDLRKLIENIYRQIAKKDLDLKTELRQWIAKTSGSNTLAQIVSKGVTYPAGVDLTRVGMGSVAPDSPLAAAGIPFDMLIGRPSRAFEKGSSGDPYGAVAELTPNFIKHWIVAGGWAVDGVRDKQGSRILRPQDLSDSDIGMKALGFQPSIISDIRDYEYAQRRQETAVDALKRRYTNQLAKALAAMETESDPKELAKLEERVAEVYADLDAHNETASEEQQIVIGKRALDNRIQREAEGIKSTWGKERKNARGAAEDLRGVFGLSEDDE